MRIAEQAYRFPFLKILFHSYLEISGNLHQNFFFKWNASRVSRICLIASSILASDAVFNFTLKDFMLLNLHLHKVLIDEKCHKNTT